MCICAWLAEPRALPTYNFLQPLVWSDWLGLFSVKGFFYASLSTCWSIRLGGGGKGGQLEPWEASFTCCRGTCIEDCMWELQKEYWRTLGTFFIPEKFSFPRHMQLSNWMWVAILCAAGDGSRFHSYLPPVREGKTVETASSHHCWIPSCLSAP